MFDRATTAGGGIPRRYATPRLYGVLGPGGGHDYAVEASTSERVASVFTKMGVPSPASIRSGVTVPGALVARSLEWQQRRRPRLSSRRRGAEGWPTGGAVLLPAPPIGQPSDRSIGAQSRFRSEKAAGAAADPSRDASSFLCSPMRREATRQCSARHSRRRLRWARVGRSGGTLFARHLPTSRRQPRAAADGGAVGAAAAAPPVGGALVVAWAALRRRSARPGSGGSLRRHGFERGCRASSGAGWLRAGLRSQLFSFLASNKSAVRALKVRNLILESLLVTVSQSTERRF